MATLYKRGLIWWIDYTLPGGKRVRKSLGKKKKYAEDYRRALELKILQRRHHYRSLSPKLHDILNAYLESARVDLKPKSFIRYQEQLQTFFSWFKEKRPIDSTIEVISPHLIEQYKRHLFEAGKAPKTIKDSLQTISQLLNWCVRMEFINKNRLRGNIKYPKVYNRLPRIYTPEELQKIFGRATGEFRLFLEICYRAGFRLEEVLSIQAMDFDKGQKLIQYHNLKAGRDEWFPCSDRLTEIFVTLCHDKKPRDYLFDFPLSGNSRQNKLRLRFQKILKELELPPGTLHSLKASYGTHLLDAGVNILVVKELLHHKHIETTMRYLRPATQQQMRNSVGMLPV